MILTAFYFILPLDWTLRDWIYGNMVWIAIVFLIQVVIKYGREYERGEKNKKSLKNG
jgi:Na+/alanine symporter